MSRLRKISAAVAAFAVVAAGVISVPLAANAAIGPNPSVDLTVTKTFDGTGFGTDAATFVNSANGFNPGDNSATDGIVSSGDLVGYDVLLKIKAGVARTVAVTMSPTEMLEWREGKNAFCAPAPGITAELQANTCFFTIAAGATASITRSVTMTGKDTAGLAVDNQKLSVLIGLRNRASYATVSSDPVTVVSAPAADLVIHPQNGANNLYQWAQNGTGFFDVKVLPLKRPGFSPTKGASVLGAWTATADVSEFPAGTTWTLGSTAVPMVDGKLQLSGTGDQRLTFTMPNSTWPDQEVGESKLYNISLTVPKSALSSVDYLNNGDGWQPGNGIGRDVSTFDAAKGSTAGIPYANNDYSRVRVFRVNEPTGIFSKDLEYPAHNGQSKFEPGNMNFADAEYTGKSYPARPAQVAPGTELIAQPYVLLDRVPTPNPVSITLGDEWNPAQQTVNGALSAALSDGTRINPAGYKIWWSTTATGAEVGNRNATAGWVQQTAPPAGAKAVRVTFLPGAIPVGAEANAGERLILNVPMRTTTDIAQDAPETVFVDHMWGSIDDQEPVTISNAVQVIFQKVPTLAIRQSVDTATALPGATLNFTIDRMTVRDPLTLSAGLNTSVTVLLDACAINPKNTSSEWDMTLTPGVPGPSGRICGDPDATPSTLTFTPKAGYSYKAWNPSTYVATLWDIGYSATLSNAAQGSLTSSAELSLNGMGNVNPVSDDDAVTIIPQAVSAAVVSADPTQAEIDRELNWTVDLVSTSNGAEAAATIVALPRNNDGSSYFGGVSNPESYPGATTSDFQGSYTVSGVALDESNTSAGVELYYTVEPNPSLDPSNTAATWYLVSEAGINGNPPLSGATAVKVIAPANSAGTASQLKITVDATGNAEEDVYLLWAGETKTENSGTPMAPMPWPAQIDVVMGTISGTVWWDQNNDASMGPVDDEPRIEGSTIGLFSVTDGAVATDPEFTTTTNGDGFYEFNGLFNGNYVTRVVEAGPNLPAEEESYYGVELPVDETYSYEGNKFNLASTTSTNIALPVGGNIPDVDYGFFQSEPKVDIDKSAGTTICLNGVCDVYYNLTITNLGNTPIPGMTFTDTASDELYGVEAVFGRFEAPIVKMISRSPEATLTGYAINEDGKVYAWGSNASGGNGNGLDNATMTTSATPVQGLDGIAVKDVLPRGTNGAYALTEDGKVYSWGSGANGANGNGSSANNLTAQPVQGLDGVTVSKLYVRDNGTGAYALSDDGRIYAWGSGANGANANGSLNAELTARQVVTSQTIKEIIPRGNNYGAYAITTSGSLIAWGSAATSSLGNGAESGNAELPVAVNFPAGELIASVEARGQQGAYAVSESGKVYSWGRGANGALGNGATANRSTPVLVQGLDSLVAVRVLDRGTDGAYVRTASGEIYAWGTGGNNSLGNGSTANALTAQKVQGLDGEVIAELTVRSNAGAYVRTESGKVYAWGAGVGGGNGNGGSTNNPTAQIVQGLDGVFISKVLTRSFNQGGTALASDGKAYTWGLGTRGENGNGTGSKTVASAVAAPMTFTSLAVNVTAPTYALGTDGKAYYWSTAATPRLVPGLPGGFVPGDSAIPPINEASNGDFIERTYQVSTVPVGGELNIVVKGKVNQSTAPFNVLNQAWVTSPTTPIAGLLPPGQTKPTLPTDPGSPINPDGIPGNPTCDTDVNGQNPLTPDSCDQVPVQIPASAIEPGSLSGNVWVDANGSGIKNPADQRNLPNVKVYLYSGDVLMGEALTDGDGNYSFTNLPPRNNYSVTFEVLGATPSTEIIDWVGVDPTKSYSYAFTTPSATCEPNTSCAIPASSKSPAVSVVAGAETQNVNAGLVLVSAAIEVTKTSVAGDPANLQLVDGFTPETPVDLTFTNTGTEPLTNFSYVDVTLEGPYVYDLICLFNDEIVDAFTVLAPGETANCTAMLLPMEYGQQHSDIFTVNATSTITGTPVQDDDDWSAVVEGTPQWTLEKTADPESGEMVLPNTDITYTLLATNYGDMDIIGAQAIDNLSEVLNNASIDASSLPEGLALDGQTLTWSIPRIEPGASVSVSYTVRVNEDAWDVSLNNTVYGTGVVPPDECYEDEPCETIHMTPFWSGPIGLPELGGAGTALYLTLGALILAAAAALVLRNGRSKKDQQEGASLEG